MNLSLDPRIVLPKAKRYSRDNRTEFYTDGSTLLPRCRLTCVARGSSAYLPEIVHLFRMYVSWVNSGANQEGFDLTNQLLLDA